MNNQSDSSTTLPQARIQIPLSSRVFRKEEIPYTRIPHLKSGLFSLEELSDDDVGYDADIEVVRPDQYEEAESDHEPKAALEDEGYDSADSEDRLAHRMTTLSCDPAELDGISRQRGQRLAAKRMSREMDPDMLDDTIRKGRPDLEVEELSVHTDEKKPAKRRRKRLERSKTGERIVHVIAQDWAENSGKPEAEDAMLVSSSSSNLPPATPEVHDPMDIE